MNDNEAVLVELRKIAAWADMQRKATKGSLIFFAIVFPVVVTFSIVMIVLEHHERIKAIDTSGTPLKPSCYDVEHSIRSGNFDKAIELGEELVKATPQLPENHRELATAYLTAGKLDKAKKHFAEAVRLFPSEENEKLLNAIEKRIKTEQWHPVTNVSH